MKRIIKRGFMDNTEPEAATTIFEALYYALKKMMEEKPNDRSDLDRYFAICITELEKLIAVYSLYCESEASNESD